MYNDNGEGEELMKFPKQNVINEEASNQFQILDMETVDKGQFNFTLKDLQSIKFNPDKKNLIINANYELEPESQVMFSIANGKFNIKLQFPIVYEVHYKGQLSFYEPDDEGNIEFDSDYDRHYFKNCFDANDEFETGKAIKDIIDMSMGESVIENKLIYDDCYAYLDDNYKDIMKELNREGSNMIKTPFSVRGHGIMRQI